MMANIGRKVHQAGFEWISPKLGAWPSHELVESGLNSQESHVQFTKIANEQRLLPDAFLDDSKTMVTQAFMEYALPLIGESLTLYPNIAHIKVTI